MTIIYDFNRNPGNDMTTLFMCHTYLSTVSKHNLLSHHTVCLHAYVHACMRVCACMCVCVSIMFKWLFTRAWIPQTSHYQL